MQGNVRKKRDEVDLWEIVSTERNAEPRRRPRPQYDVRETDSRRRQSQVSERNRQSRPQQNEGYRGRMVQLIGQEEYEQSERPRRQEQARNGRSRSVQVIGREEYEGYGRPRRQERQEQTRNGRSRSVQVIGQEEYERYGRPRRQERQEQTRNGRSRSGQVIGREEYGRYERPRRKSREAYIKQRERAAYIAKRKRERKRRALFYRMVAFAMIVGCMTLVVTFGGLVYQNIHKEKKIEKETLPVKEPVIHEADMGKISAPRIAVDLLEINEFSRPGTELNEINSIFVHYTANPGTSAAQNRSYFANLAETQERSASAHYIIGYEGEIVQCIPINEQAYAVMTRNEDSISIECCYLEEDGEFTQETYDSLVHMLAWLLQEHNLECSDILRHYDCGGKRCPLYFVDHEDAWMKLIADVETYIDEHTQFIDVKS